MKVPTRNAAAASTSPAAFVSSSRTRATILIPLAALIAILPLLRHGCSCGHDFDFHLLSWMEAARQYAAGNLHPHWAFTPAFNAGEPRFIFYPPISWYLGALLGIIFRHLPGISEAAAWNATPIVFTWMALVASGFTMYRLARIYANANAALLASILYLANPYMLFTVYERTAYAELLAAAWIPLLLHSILQERITAKGIAIPVALLWLTNAPAAVMGSYTLALLAFMRIVGTYRCELATVIQIDHPRPRRLRHRESMQIAARTLAGTMLGLALAGFYILPAAYERRFVQITMATISGMRIDQNFLFEHTGSTADALLHDQVLHTASIIAILLLIGTMIALAVSFARAKVSKFPVLQLAIVTGGIAFLLVPLSLPLWTHAPEAAFLQFPWRLLAILAAVFALAAAHALDRRQLPGVTAVSASIALALTLTPIAYRSFRQACDPEDTPSARLALFHSNTGTDPTDEYTPATADNDALTPGDPPYWLADSPTAAPPASANPGPAPAEIAVSAEDAQHLILNLRDYPAWRITINNTVATQREHRPDGLIAMPIPAGRSTIAIFYTRTADQTLGDAITLLGLAAMLPLLLIKRTKDA